MIKKSVAIFGSTGSIGNNALQVIAQHSSQYQVVALVAGSDVKTLIKQAKIFKPKYVAINDEKHFAELKKSMAGLKIEVLAGQKAINDLAKIKVDFFLSAIVGIAALIPTLNAIKAGCNIGMANKECLVAAGDLMLKAAKKSGSKILPIDSEHNAIFQIFEQQNLDKIERIILTASGGPFLNFSAAQMKNISVAQAVKHPNWSMGAKISVDSATMMNKALEVIEAYRLFPIGKEQIEIVIHPESIIHGLVDYADGSTLAMMSLPDMQVPISYALAYPKRITIKHPKLDLAKISRLNFLAPDAKK
jgi:1-deoxy-D-xylulose-5-phosphate reductoisomerase